MSKYFSDLMAIINIKKIRYGAALIISAFHQFRLRFVVLIFLGLIGGLSESIGIGAAIPLFYLMTGQRPEEADIVSRSIAFLFAHLHIPLTPVFLLSFILFLFITKAIIQFIARYTTARIVSRFEEHMRRDLLDRTLKTTWPHLLQYKSGHLEAVFLYDMERAGSVLNLLSVTILTATTFLTYTIVALTISTPITLITLALGSALFLILKPYFYRTRQLFQEAVDLQKTMSHHISENFAGAKIIKATGTEHKVIEKINRYFRMLRNAKTRSSFYRQSTLAFTEPIGFILITILFIVSYRSPGFNIASFAVVMYLIQKMFSFTQSLQTQGHNINEMIPNLKAVFDYRKTARKNKEEETGSAPFHFERNIAFNHVHFSYDTERPVISDVTFDIPKGSMIGLVGSSGAGKTTIGDLILRLFTPQEGTITVDGDEIQSISLAQWRKHIGYVSQDAFLLNETIRNNIIFYSDSVTANDMEQATKMANIYDTIQALPEGFDTVVGERGVKLSGGQRQRIVLARALARNPDILLLDEATSAIDNESEALIQKAITSLHGKVTTLIIAHRLSTIMHADMVVVLEHGRIVESGQPQALLNNPTSHFARLYAAAERSHS
jgi:ABC-type multidrug transport system fused ATPase/permease subunit